jgi:uncharacterized CHY-type Zn-finger protein
MSLFKFELSKSEYAAALKESDGLCGLCNEWLTGKVDPDTEKMVCPYCKNKTVYGIKKAIELGFIQVVGLKEKI